MAPAISRHLKYKYAGDLKEGCHEPVHDRSCSGDRGTAVSRDICRGSGQARTQGRAVIRRLDAHRITEWLRISTEWFNMILRNAGPRACYLSIVRSVASCKARTDGKDDMTYAMWGIAIGLALMFGVSLQRYRRSLMRKREIRWMGENHVLDRLRKQLGLSLEK